MRLSGAAMHLAPFTAFGLGTLTSLHWAGTQWQRCGGVSVGYRRPSWEQMIGALDRRAERAVVHLPFLRGLGRSLREEVGAMRYVSATEAKQRFAKVLDAAPPTNGTDTMPVKNPH